MQSFTARSLPHEQGTCLLSLHRGDKVTDLTVPAVCPSLHFDCEAVSVVAVILVTVTVTVLVTVLLRCYPCRRDPAICHAKTVSNMTMDRPGDLAFNTIYNSSCGLLRKTQRPSCPDPHYKRVKHKLGFEALRTTHRAFGYSSASAQLFPFVPPSHLCRLGNMDFPHFPPIARNQRSFVLKEIFLFRSLAWEHFVPFLLNHQNLQIQMVAFLHMKCYEDLSHLFPSESARFVICSHGGDLSHPQSLALITIALLQPHCIDAYQ